MTTDLSHCFVCLGEMDYESVYLTVKLDDGDYILCFVCLQDLQKLSIEAQEVRDVLTDDVLNEIF